MTPTNAGSICEHDPEMRPSHLGWYDLVLRNFLSFVCFIISFCSRPVIHVGHLQLHFRLSLCSFDSQVAYWDVYDGSIIRELEGSQSGAINGMHITQDGKHFVTGYTSAACCVASVLRLERFTLGLNSKQR